MRGIGKAIDPRAMLFDMSSDPLTYGEPRCEMVKAEMKNILKDVSDPGKSWQEVGQAYSTLSKDANSSLTAISRYIGGVYVERAVQGQADGVLPFKPVEADSQRRALQALAKHAFAPDTLAAPPELYAHLQQQRRGLVLAGLMRLKQICNHPAHFLKDASALPARSGKLDRVEELLDELLVAGDKALCFTQFTEWGEQLVPYLARRFDVPVLWLHGGTPRRRRDDMVAQFQSLEGPAVFMLSLKAGGTGLNLTAASHVVHFDRWWNPAVEDQATDRAFRIGQHRNVMVHKMVCTGTIEERIDAMIDRKRALAGKVVGTGETWITELSGAELRELITYDASGEEG
jgi:SNF2 family DNA or RNA helicase